MTDLHDDLDAADDVWNVDDEPPVLDGIDQAVRLMARRHRIMRRAHDLDQARAARQALIDEQQADLDAWTADVMGGIERALDWHDQALTSWHRAMLADDPRAKTIDLAGLGKLTARKQQPEWDVDADVFLPWATEHRPDLVRVPEPKPAPDKAAIKKAAGDLEPGDPGVEVVPCVDLVDESTGEIVTETMPGVVVRHRGVKFEVKPEGIDL